MRSQILFLLILKYRLVFSINSTYNYIFQTTPRELSAAENAVWCRFQPSGYDCNETGRYTEDYYYDIKLQDCKLFNFGTCKHNQNKFSTIKDCRTSCLDSGSESIYGRIAAQTYCKFQPDFGLCSDYFPLFYFDLTTRTCRGFSYSGCGGNLNRFSTMQRCNTVCGSLADKLSKELT